MKPFEVFMCHPPEWNEAHPCVVVSHPDRAERKQPVEVVMCSSQRTKRAAEATEVILDTADGMDWPTLCKCDLIVSMPREELKHRRGRVSEARQMQIIQRIIAAHGWGEVAMIHRA